MYQTNVQTKDNMLSVLAVGLLPQESRFRCRKGGSSVDYFLVSLAEINLD
jgi:hypothetical protein